MTWKIKQAIEEYEYEFDQRPTKEELADILGVTLDTLNAVMSCSSRPISLDKPIRYSSGESGRTLGDIIPEIDGVDPDHELDRQKVVSVIKEVLTTLTDREEKIMRMRFGILEDPTDHTKFPISKNEIIDLQARKKETPHEHA
jgi:RNA polymerase primary sigma factor